MNMEKRRIHAEKIKSEIWRIQRIKANKADLEEEIMAYWKSIPNDSSIPAKEPDLIRIKSVEEDFILYEKMMKQGDKYVSWGIGTVSKKELKSFTSRLDNVYERLTKELETYDATKY